MDLLREQRLAYLIERKFVALVVQIKKEKGMKQKEIAPLAFPDMKVPTRKWQQVVGLSRMKRPQRISFADAYFLALSVGETPFGLYVRAYEEVRADLRSGVSSLDDNGPLDTKRK
jgi:hypothetical protein